MRGSEGYLWSWKWWGYLSQGKLSKGTRWFSTSGYHLLKANCSMYLREEVSHRGCLSTTCRDEGILTRNDLITLSQTPLTSSPCSPDITILLGHNGGSKLPVMGMFSPIQGTLGAAARAATPPCPNLTAQQPSPEHIPAPGMARGPLPKADLTSTAPGPVAFGIGMYKDHGPSRRKLVMISLGN